jgi:hypothetical protein
MTETTFIKQRPFVQVDRVAARSFALVLARAAGEEHGDKECLKKMES